MSPEFSLEPWTKKHVNICTCVNSIVVCGQHFHCLQLENSLEMNDEEPKPGTGNSDSTSFVYSQSYDVMFFMFLPQHKPLLSRIFPREIKTRNCCNIPTWKAQNSSYLTRVLLKSVFHLHGTFLSEAYMAAIRIFQKRKLLQTLQKISLMFSKENN